MRVILDTSVIVSALISPHGTPAKLILRWYDDAFVLLYTQEMYAELEDVLKLAWLKQRLAGAPNRVLDYLNAVSSLGQQVTGTVDVAGQVRDPFGEMFLACARLGQADYLVSVDKDLLSLDEYEGTKIVTPAQFLKLLDDSPTTSN